jgi:LacI family transcriptional regulator
MKKISLKDIALKVGVSTAAVSYVLNNKEKELKIGKELAAKIREVAKKMNYQPNLIAKSLKSGSTNTIGIIFEDISNPFFANLASIIEKEAHLQGYTVILGCSYEDLQKSETLLNTLLTRQVDGIIITPVDESSAQILRLKKMGIPYVLVDRYFSNVPSNSIIINNYDISYKAVEHLIKKGYRKIGMIAFNSGFEHMNDRIRGYQQALKDHKIKVSKRYLSKINFGDGHETIESAIRQMLTQEDKVDSLFFANNIIGVKALKVISEMKIKVPNELGIICFDERDVFDYYYSPLSYIKQDLKQIGQEAVRLLIHSIKEKDVRPSKVVVNAELVIRKSSAKA